VPLPGAQSSERCTTRMKIQARCASIWPDGSVAQTVYAGPPERSIPIVRSSAGISCDFNGLPIRPGRQKRGGRPPLFQ
jgi:hypothetical protein